MNSLLKAKTYHFYIPKTLYGKKRYFLQDKLRVECVGGENMTEENELVFLKPEDIPRLMRGQSGRNWEELFDKIPKGQVLPMNTKTYGSVPNIRSQVKIYNETHKDKTLEATQRTDKETEEITVYVTRVK